MPIITLAEIIYLIILTIALGYIFSGFIRSPDHYRFPRKMFDWKDIKYSMLIAAPAVILHELFHKFAALAFGLEATFHIWPTGLGLAVFLKLISSPFLIIAPGYVAISQATPIQMTITAAAGPFANLILFLGAAYILNNAKKLTRRQAVTLYLTKKINLLLLIFNLIPIPPLDGSKVLFGLIEIIKTMA